MFCDLADERRDILLDVLVGVLEAREDCGEDLGLDNHLGEVDAVLRYLTQGREDLSL